MAFLGAYLLHRLGESSAQDNVERILGAALLLGAAAMVLRFILDRRGSNARQGVVNNIVVHPVRTVLIGMIGGLVVGMTSVGSGSLMIVLLLFLYPVLGANQLVGTDLTQALPLTAAVVLGALAFGHVEFAVTTSLIIGSVPAVLVGSVLSSRAPDRYIRPAITFVIFASGLKYVGVGNTQLGCILVAALAAAFITWLVLARPWVQAPDQQRRPRKGRCRCRDLDVTGRTASTITEIISNTRQGGDSASDRGRPSAPTGAASDSYMRPSRSSVTRERAALQTDLRDAGVYPGRGISAGAAVHLNPTAGDQTMAAGANEATSFTYTIYIQATPEQVWQGLTDPNVMKRYWRHQRAGEKTFRSDWEQGSTYDMLHEEVGLVVSDPEQVILESDPHHRLAYTWHTITPEWAAEVGMDDATAEAWRAEPRSRVAFDIADVGHGAASLTVVHDGFDPGSHVLQGISEGWPAVLSSLKTVLETGSTLRTS